MKTAFDLLGKAQALLNDSEDTLKDLRDNIDRPEQVMVNKALEAYGELRTKLWAIDKALERYDNEKEL